MDIVRRQSLLFVFTFSALFFSLSSLLHAMEEEGEKNISCQIIRKTDIKNSIKSEINKIKAKKPVTSGMLFTLGLITSSILGYQSYTGNISGNTLKNGLCLTIPATLAASLAFLPCSYCGVKSEYEEMTEEKINSFIDTTKTIKFNIPTVSIDYLVNLSKIDNNIALKKVLIDNHANLENNVISNNIKNSIQEKKK